jgi:hypothetical protein
MDHQFGHPSSKKLLGAVADLFRANEIFATNDRYIVFVCGGNDKPRKPAVRSRFIDYAKRNIPGVRVFLAENAAQDLLSHSKPRFLNVAEFEQLLADIADCVLIFPESPGSIAEAAYFSHDEKIRRKILVVSDLELQSEDSFINLGPLALINDESVFRPVIQIDYRRPVYHFHHIKKRLARHLTGRREQVDYSRNENLGPREILFLVYELVRVFGVINLGGLRLCLGNILGSPAGLDSSSDNLPHLLSILYAAGYVHRRGDDRQYFVPAEGMLSFLEVKSDRISALTVQAANYYRDNEPSAYSLLRGVRR